VLSGLLALGCGGGGSTPPPPVIASFAATPPTVTLGNATTLSWSASGATSLRLDPAPGTVTGASLSVSPSAPTTYTLTATGPGGSTQAQVAVAVNCLVTFSPGSGGSLTGTIPQTVPYGGSTSPVTAVPATGYVLSGWSGTGFTPTAANPLSVSEVTTNLAISASFAVETFTVSFSPQTGGSLTGTTPQTVPYGGSCTPVTAAPAPGWIFTGWTGSGFVSSSVNPLTLTNVTSDLALTACFQNLVPDLATWLQAHPTVGAAIQWQFQYPAGGNAYTPPGPADMIAWVNWSQSQKDDLEAAYLDAGMWLAQGRPRTITLPYRGVSDAPENWYTPQTDSTPAMQWTSPTDMWNLYVAHVGFSLALETTHGVPWSLTDYDAQGLRYLLDSSTMGWKLPYGPVSFSLGTYGGANLPALRADNRPKTPFTHPMAVYQWMAQNSIPGSTRLASIGGTLDWMRFHMTHFYGTDDFGTCFAVWQYKGYPPIARIIGGTVDANNPSLGSLHWTLGCHGSVGFLSATLRALNIPVQPVWVGGHELACFLSERMYLDHGDDPYNSVVRVDHASAPILGVLIDEPTYQNRFTSDLTVNLNNPSDSVLANIGKAAADFQ